MSFNIGLADQKSEPERSGPVSLCSGIRRHQSLLVKVAVVYNGNAAHLVGLPNRDKQTDCVAAERTRGGAGRSSL